MTCPLSADWEVLEDVTSKSTGRDRSYPGQGREGRFRRDQCRLEVGGQGEREGTWGGSGAEQEGGPAGMWGAGGLWKKNMRRRTQQRTTIS